jgi:hypothetical protein
MIPAVPEFYRIVQEDRPVFWEIVQCERKEVHI